MTHLFVNLPVATLVGAFCAASLGAQTVLLDDQFNDANYNGARTASSGEVLAQGGWFSSASGGVNAAGNALTFTSNGLVVGYFAPVTMEVGETLTLNFDLSLTEANNTVNSLRFGLTDSNGTRTTADGQTGAAGLRNDDDGFYVGLNPDNIVGGSRQYFATGDSTKSELFFSGTQRFSGGMEALISANTTINVTFEYTLTDANTINQRIEVLGDGTHTNPLDGTNWNSTIASTDPAFTTTFDTVGLYLSDNNRGSFDNVSVVYSGTIPEPTTTALLIGSVVAICAISVRRRHS